MMTSDDMNANANTPSHGGKESTFPSVPSHRQARSRFRAGRRGHPGRGFPDLASTSVGACRVPPGTLLPIQLIQQ